MPKHLLMITGIILLLAAVFLASYFNLFDFSKINFAKKLTTQPAIAPPVSITAMPFISPSPVPTIPTPTPLLGPGQYACDPLGICNDYSDEMRVNCSVTYADRDCLHACADPANRCTK